MTRSVWLFSVFQLKNQNQTEPVRYIFLKTEIKSNQNITDRTGQFGSVCTKRYFEQRFVQTRTVQNATPSSVLYNLTIRVGQIHPKLVIFFSFHPKITKNFSNYPKMEINFIFYPKLVIVPKMFSDILRIIHFLGKSGLAQPSHAHH